MIKMYVFLFLCFFSLSASAQLNSSDTSKIEQYCMLIAQQKFLSSKVNVIVDSGEKKSFWKDNRLKNENGDNLEFNGIVDALNYMGKIGWILHSAYPITVGNSNIYHYVFKKFVDKKLLEEKQ